MYYNIHRQLCVRVSGAAVKPSMFLTMCSSRKYIHTLPNRKDYFQTSPPPLHPPLKFHFSFNHFFKFFDLRKKKQGNSNLFCGGSLDISRNCTLFQKAYACLLTKEASGLLISIPADLLASSTISFTLRRHSSSPMSCEIEVNICEYVKTHYLGKG